MCLFPHEWSGQKPWSCPECGRILYTSVRTDTNDWRMCIQCEAKEIAERMAFEHQQEITKHNLLIARPAPKPKYKYNWKTGKAELIKQ